jgi:hypothetical protein
MVTLLPQSRPRTRHQLWVHHDEPAAVLSQKAGLACHIRPDAVTLPNRRPVPLVNHPAHHIHQSEGLCAHHLRFPERR